MMDQEAMKAAIDAISTALDQLKSAVGGQTEAPPAEVPAAPGGGNSLPSFLGK